MHRIAGKNSYCGPAALSYLTGLSTDESARLFRLLSGRRSIKGLNNSEMLAGLNKLKLISEKMNIPGNATCTQLLDDLPGLFLVGTTDHFFILDDGMLYDNHHREGVPFTTGAPYRRARVDLLVRVKMLDPAQAAQDPLLQKSKKTVSPPLSSTDIDGLTITLKAHDTEMLYFLEDATHSLPSEAPWHAFDYNNKCLTATISARRHIRRLIEAATYAQERLEYNSRHYRSIDRMLATLLRFFRDYYDYLPERLPSDIEPPALTALPVS